MLGFGEARASRGFIRSLPTVFHPTRIAAPRGNSARTCSADAPTTLLARLPATVGTPWGLSWKRSSVV